MAKTFFLIPTIISKQNHREVLPAALLSTLNTIDLIVTENIKTTRRYLRSIGFDKDFNQIPYFILDKKTSFEEVFFFYQKIEQDTNIGIFSEAGMPGIADPGAVLLDIAHQYGDKVKPIVGPSSIFLALSASGFNGQKFAFHGYLPVKKNERIKEIKKIENQIYKEDQTQIFIETPYRNNAMMESLLATCKPTTKICVAAEITGEDEKIVVGLVSSMRKKKWDFHKKNAVFLLYK